MPENNLMALQSEIESGLLILRQQIRGMEDLVKVSLSPIAIDALNHGLQPYIRRRDRMEGLLAALKLLAADGYPSDLHIDVPPDIFKELKEQIVDFIAAMQEIIEEDVSAKTVVIEVGQPTPKLIT